MAKWSKEQIDKLGTPELRVLLANAERLQEPEVAALCNQLLDARPRGRPAVRRDKRSGAGRRLVSRRKAFQMHGVSLRNRVWSRGGMTAGGTLFLTLRADEVQEAHGTNSYLLWAPNVAASRPWSDTPGGEERLEHCRHALERGAAEGLLIYGTGADRVDAETVLSLRVEKRGEEYWATCAPQKRVVVNTFE